MNTSLLRTLLGCLSFFVFAAEAAADPMDCRAVTIYSTGEASMKAPFDMICPVSGGVKEGFLPLLMAAKVLEVTVRVQTSPQSGWDQVRIPIGGIRGIDLKCIISKVDYEAAGCD